MSQIEHAHLTRDAHFVKHAHLPQSIWAARVVWGRWELDNFRVMVDIEQCPGCCDGPQKITTTINDWDTWGGLGMPGLMSTVFRTHSLKLDGWVAQVDKCSGQQIKLGDYGDCVDGILTCMGNIYDDMWILGIDREDPACRPVVSGVSSDTRLIHCTRNQTDVAIAYHMTGDTHLALHQARGISLPPNDDFMLLLTAFSIRLVGKHLVTTIIQCSDFYGIDQDGNRRGSGDDSMPESGHRSTESGVLTPLCAVASPQVWRREPLCVPRREQFQSIREHFYALHQPTGPELRFKYANRQKKDRAVKFFSEMFGLEYLRIYIGEITFFARLPWMMETNPPSDGLYLSAAEEENPPTLSRANWVTRYNLLWGNQQSQGVRLDARHEAVLPLLDRRCQTLRAQCKQTYRYAAEKQKVECEVKSISQTLGAGLLKPLLTTFRNLCCALEHGRAAGRANIDYDRQLDAPSVVQEVQALQVKLDAVEDEDEQRALEEDITGKILWLCWCGICAEADELLPKVVDYLGRNENIGGLQEIFLALLAVTLPCEPGDDQAHLRRIMLDAGAPTSKHQLLLAARAADQAMWSSATKSTVATGNQGPTASTSSQVPSVSVV
ncbi:hypothetical protein PISMIDRAFT_675444 [Pisolithus microcarpus 441]|uniref:Uncharacterized protein n=1 Tax=Pisolithus microcarpus 441 TaxID=765257 RepID=A0A0D0A438_9AGAM|nr:hypothetical protein BKA83DRAFT_675444 [Pisolithus microcarpus]KIK26823.1 hypothetical protein PISMIDRAFT_675444 [Pisolithus microcarpus 441]